MKRRVRPVTGIHKVVVIEPFKILFPNFFGVEKKLPKGMLTGYATRNSVIYVIVTSDTATEIC